MRAACLLQLVATAAGFHLTTPPAPLARSCTTALPRANIQLADGQREISDAETAFRWIGVQGSVDVSIILLFAYDLKRKIGEDLPFDEFIRLAIQEPGLKFLILMPALTVFFQILRRFGAEDGIVTRYRPFEEDPIVKFLGGAEKVRSIRNRWLEISTVKAK